MSLGPLIPAQADDGTVRVLEPDTGVIYELADAPAPLLAQHVDYLIDLAHHVREARGVLEFELQRRLGRERTMDVGSHMVEASQRREWDAGATWQALSDLVAGELVTAAEADEAMPERTERKPDGRKLNALLTRLVGEDPAAASPLAQARSSRTTIKVHAVAVDGEAREAA